MNASTAILNRLSKYCAAGIAAVVPGSSVMTDVIGYENMALGVPIDRLNIKPYLYDFIQSLRSSGQLKVIITRSGLRGAANKSFLQYKG